MINLDAEIQNADWPKRTKDWPLGTGVPNKPLDPKQTIKSDTDVISKILEKHMPEKPAK